MAKRLHVKLHQHLRYRLLIQNTFLIELQTTRRLQLINRTNKHLRHNWNSDTCVTSANSCLSADRCHILYITTTRGVRSGILFVSFESQLRIVLSRILSLKNTKKLNESHRFTCHNPSISRSLVGFFVDIMNLEESRLPLYSICSQKMTIDTMLSNKRFE